MKKKQIKKIVSEVRKFIFKFGVKGSVKIRIYEQPITARVKAVYRNPSESFNDDDSYFIECSIQSPEDPFDPYHEAGHIILGTLIHKLLASMKQLKKTGVDELAERIDSIFHLLDLVVDDFLFKEKNELVVRRFRGISQRESEAFNQLKQFTDSERKQLIVDACKIQYESAYLPPQNEIILNDFIIITLALQGVQIENYLNENDLKENFERMHELTISVAEEQIDPDYPFKERFSQLKKVLKAHSFKVNNAEDLVKFLADLLKCFELPVEIKNEKGYIAIKK